MSQSSPLKLALLHSRFNHLITSSLVNGAKEELERNHIGPDSVESFSVPGALELPYAFQQLAATKKYDGIVVLGCVIRGETSHYDHLCNSTIHLLSEISTRLEVPAGIGLLTVESLDQALQRSGGKAGHKGIEATQVCLEMINFTKNCRS